MPAPFMTIACFFSHLQRLKLITLPILSWATSSPLPLCVEERGTVVSLLFLILIRSLLLLALLEED